MTEKLEKLKTFNVRISRELWTFLKKNSTDIDKPMNTIVQNLIEKYREKSEKKMRKDVDML